MRKEKILKQEWLLVFWNKIQTHKRFKIMLFIRTRQNQKKFMVIPIVKLQKDTWTTAKWKITLLNQKQISGLAFYLIFHCFWLFSYCLSVVL